VRGVVTRERDAGEERRDGYPLPLHRIASRGESREQFDKQGTEPLAAFVHAGVRVAAPQGSASAPLHRLAESNPRQGFIERKQYDDLAANCSDLFMRTMLALAYSFGFHKSELLPLRVSDVDRLAGTIRLRDSKNGEPRKVALTVDAKNLLTECVRGKSDAVFTRGKGTKAVADFRGTWDKITLAAGVSGLLFHDLRRSADKLK
jgi:integrase